MGQSQPLFVYIRLFYMTQIKYKLIKALIVCLGHEPGAAEWKVQTNPLSYGGGGFNASSFFGQSSRVAAMLYPHSPTCALSNDHGRCVFIYPNIGYSSSSLAQYATPLLPIILSIIDCDAVNGHLQIQTVFYFITPTPTLIGFYWRHQCSWTLTPANNMQVHNMQSDDHNRN